MMDQQCTFCERTAISGGYLQPPMCELHHTIAIMISLLKSYGLPVEMGHLNRLAVAIYPKTNLSPEQISGLAQPMLEGGTLL
jgi:hypothetical protein